MYIFISVKFGNRGLYRYYQIIKNRSKACIRTLSAPCCVFDRSFNFSSRCRASSIFSLLVSRSNIYWKTRWQCYTVARHSFLYSQ